MRLSTPGQGNTTWCFRCRKIVFRTCFWEILFTVLPTVVLALILAVMFSTHRLTQTSTSRSVYSYGAPPMLHALRSFIDTKLRRLDHLDTFVASNPVGWLDAGDSDGLVTSMIPNMFPLNDADTDVASVVYDNDVSITLSAATALARVESWKGVPHNAQVQRRRRPLVFEGNHSFTVWVNANPSSGADADGQDGTGAVLNETAAALTPATSAAPQSVAVTGSVASAPIQRSLVSFMQPLIDYNLPPHGFVGYDLPKATSVDTLVFGGETTVNLEERMIGSTTTAAPGSLDNLVPLIPTLSLADAPPWRAMWLLEYAPQAPAGSPDAAIRRFRKWRFPEVFKRKFSSAKRQAAASAAQLSGSSSTLVGGSSGQDVIRTFTMTNPGNQLVALRFRVAWPLAFNLAAVTERFGYVETSDLLLLIDTDIAFASLMQTCLNNSMITDTTNTAAVASATVLPTAVLNVPTTTTAAPTTTTANGTAVNGTTTTTTTTTTPSPLLFAPTVSNHSWQFVYDFSTMRVLSFSCISKEHATIPLNANTGSFDLLTAFPFLSGVLNAAPSASSSVDVRETAATTNEAFCVRRDVITTLGWPGDATGDTAAGTMAATANAVMYPPGSSAASSTAVLGSLDVNVSPSAMTAKAPSDAGYNPFVPLSSTGFAPNQVVIDAINAQSAIPERYGQPRPSTVALLTIGRVASLPGGSSSGNPLSVNSNCNVHDEILAQLMIRGQSIQKTISEIRKSVSIRTTSATDVEALEAVIAPALVAKPYLVAVVHAPHEPLTAQAKYLLQFIPAPSPASSSATIPTQDLAKAVKDIFPIISQPPLNTSLQRSPFLMYLTSTTTGVTSTSASTAAEMITEVYRPEKAGVSHRTRRIPDPSQPCASDGTFSASCSAVGAVRAGSQRLSKGTLDALDYSVANYGDYGSRIVMSDIGTAKADTDSDNSLPLYVRMFPWVRGALAINVSQDDSGFLNGRRVNRYVPYRNLNGDQATVFANSDSLAPGTTDATSGAAGPTSEPLTFVTKSRYANIDQLQATGQAAGGPQTTQAPYTTTNVPLLLARNAYLSWSFSTSPIERLMSLLIQPYEYLSNLAVYDDGGTIATAIAVQRATSAGATAAGANPLMYAEWLKDVANDQLINLTTVMSSRGALARDWLPSMRGRIRAIMARVQAVGFFCQGGPMAAGPAGDDTFIATTTPAPGASQGTNFFSFAFPPYYTTTCDRRNNRVSSVTEPVKIDGMGTFQLTVLPFMSASLPASTTYNTTVNNSPYKGTSGQIPSIFDWRDDADIDDDTFRSDLPTVSGRNWWIVMFAPQQAFSTVTTSQAIVTVGAVVVAFLFLLMNGAYVVYTVYTMTTLRRMMRAVADGKWATTGAEASAKQYTSLSTCSEIREVQLAVLKVQETLAAVDGEFGGAFSLTSELNEIPGRGGGANRGDGGGYERLVTASGSGNGGALDAASRGDVYAVGVGITAVEMSPASATAAIPKRAMIDDLFWTNQVGESDRYGVLVTLAVAQGDWLLSLDPLSSTVTGGHTALDQDGIVAAMPLPAVAKVSQDLLGAFNQVTKRNGGISVPTADAWTHSALWCVERLPLLDRKFMPAVLSAVQLAEWANNTLPQSIERRSWPNLKLVITVVAGPCSTAVVGSALKKAHVMSGPIVESQDQLRTALEVLLLRYVGGGDEEDENNEDRRRRPQQTPSSSSLAASAKAAVAQLFPSLPPVDSRLRDAVPLGASWNVSRVGGLTSPVCVVGCDAFVRSKVMDRVAGIDAAGNTDGASFSETGGGGGFLPMRPWFPLCAKSSDSEPLLLSIDTFRQRNGNGRDRNALDRLHPLGASLALIT